MGATFNRVELDSQAKPQTDQSGEFDLSGEASEEELERVEPLSEEQFHELQKSQEYKSSSLMRSLAIEGRRKGLQAELETEQHPYNQHQAKQDALERVGNRQAAELAVGKAAFNDPRYKTDAAYRFKVAQDIAATQDTTGDGPTHRLTIGSGKPGEVVQHQRSGVTRVQLPAKVTGAEKPASKEPKPRDPNVIDLY